MVPWVATPARYSPTHEREQGSTVPVWGRGRGGGDILCPMRHAGGPEMPLSELRKGSSAAPNRRRSDLALHK